MHKYMYLYFKLVVYSKGEFYVFRGAKWEVSCSLSPKLPLCVSSHLGQIHFLKKCQEDLQFVLSCDGILKHPEISRQFLTYRPRVVTRWSTGPTDWIFLVKLWGDSLMSMLRVSQAVSVRQSASFPFSPEASSWLSLYLFKVFPLKSDILLCIKY